MSNDSSGPVDPYGQPGQSGQPGGQQPPQYNPPAAAPQGPPSYSTPQPPPAYQQPGGYQQPAYQQPGYQQQGGYPAPGYAAAGPDAYSAWPTRAGGFIIDVLIAGVPAWIIEFVGIAIGNSFGAFITFIGYLVGLVITGWNRWYKGGKTGQSLGRGVVGVKVISEQTGQPLGPLMAFVRDLAHFVDSVICYVGWLFPLWDAKRQTLADKIMSTVVVPAPKVSAEQTLKTWNQ